MLQRTPVLHHARAARIRSPRRRKLLGEGAAKVNRQRSILQQKAIYQFCQRFPGAARKLIRKVNEKQLPEGFDVDKHFNPPLYDPWDQRLCAVPNGDMYKEIRNGDASVVTANIKTFDATGIQLDDGTHLDADIIITATGLNLQLFGGMAVSVNGEPLDFPSTVAYRGAMLSGLPNFIMAIGYTNSSWTLKDRPVVRVVLPGAKATWTRRGTPRSDRSHRRTWNPPAPRLQGRLRQALDRHPPQAGHAGPVEDHDVGLQRHQNLRRGAVDDGCCATTKRRRWPRPE